MNLLLKISLFSLLFSSINLKAEPWVDTSNIFLRANIQYLSSIGIIKAPITTYPLMWQDIADDINSVYLSQFDQHTQDALIYVKHQLNMAKRSQKTLTLNAALENKRFTSFGDEYREKNNIQFSTTFMTEQLAGKISTNYSQSSIDEDNTNFDGSYAAFFLGNWVISAGMQDRWWGPGWDSSLSLTNNARSIPAISLSRKSAIPFTIPYTEIKIPWTVTTFMGIMDDNRIIKNTLLWGFRINFKPLENLEIGVTRLAQWGGKDRNQDLSTFWNVFIGKDNCGNNGLDCGVNKENEPGNQQAGYDVRYSFNLSNIPFSIYGQYFAEDGGTKGNSTSFLTEPKVHIGIDSHILLFNKATTLFLEYAETFADCSDKNNVVNGNCYYEHHIYQTGMRFHQRTIGNLYDNDSKSIVFSVITNIGTDTDLTIKLRKLELNIDNLDKAPGNPIIGNPLTEIAEDMLMLSTKVQHSHKNWRFTLGSSLSQSSYMDDIDDQNEANLYINVEYNF